MKNYDSTLETLNRLETISENRINTDNENVTITFKLQILYVKGLFLYAQTYEALGINEKAIEYLNMIESKNQSTVQANDDNIYAKSMLNLGRLHFKEKDLELSHKNLKGFFRKAKNADNKELLDIGRVNLGMIKGTKGMNEYIEMIKNTDMNEFLKMKLKFFAESN